MIDVHPPHQSVHTWRDFFIHIATIVIGLLIAIALEQTVEFLHHRHQHHQLLEDLRSEAEGRVRLMPINDRSHAGIESWLRSILQVARTAIPSNGSVTFVIPAEPSVPGDNKPETAVWDAAKASGAVNTLSRSDVEVWERVDYFLQLAQKDAEIGQAASRSLRATADQLGISLEPGDTVHLSLDQRDKLTHDLAADIEAMHDLRRVDTLAAGATDAVLHGAQTSDQMIPYINQALQSTPLQTSAPIHTAQP